MEGYNPASTRVKENTSGVDVSGVVTLVFPDGTVTNLGRGVVRVDVATPGQTGVGPPGLDGMDIHEETFMLALPAQVFGVQGPTPNDVQVFTSTGTWTKPSGAYMVLVEVIGAGGGAGSGSVGVFNTTAAGGGGGGGGGAYAKKFFKATDLPSTVTVTIGGGGPGGAAVSNTIATVGNNGTAGGDTSFGTFLKVYGGGSGAANNAGGTAGGGGGTAGAGHNAVGGGGATDGGSPQPPTQIQAIAGSGAGAPTAGSDGGNAEYGGGGGGAATQKGGSSIFGAPGGGGGGGVSAVAGLSQPNTGGAIQSYAPGGGGAAGTTGVSGAATSGTDGTNGFVDNAGTGGGGGGGCDDQAHGGTAGHGGNGGAPGAGGGGGGGILFRSGAASTSGKGGDGGRGECRVTSFAFASGAIGPMGVPGPLGPPGLQGEEPEVPLGLPGPVGPQGLKGDTGAAGISGAMVQIGTATLGADNATLASFTSIPATYNDLLLTIQGRADGTTERGYYIQFNGDSTSGHYTYQRFYSNATTMSADQSQAQTGYAVDSVASATQNAAAFTSAVVWVPNYYGTTFQKGIISDRYGLDAGDGAGEAYHVRGAGRWKDTSAINRVDVVISSGKFKAGSYCTLYGIGSH